MSRKLSEIWSEPVTILSHRYQSMDADRRQNGNSREYRQKLQTHPTKLQHPQTETRRPNTQNWHQPHSQRKIRHLNLNHHLERTSKAKQRSHQSLKLIQRTHDRRKRSDTCTQISRMQKIISSPFRKMQSRRLLQIATHPKSRSRLFS